MSRRFYTVAVHELDQGYGGPEEGGWYYDTGTPAPEHADLTRTFTSYTKAMRYLRRLRDSAGIARTGRPYWSAAYRGGDYRAVLQNGTEARAWPTFRPYYE